MNKPGPKPGCYRLISDGTGRGTRVFYCPTGRAPIELREVLSASFIVGGNQKRAELLLRVRNVEMDVEALPEGVTLTQVAE